MNLHQHAKNQINSSIHSCDTADFGVSWLKRWQTHFWLGPPIVIITNFYHHSKNQLIPLTPLWDIANSKVLWQRLSYLFLTISTVTFLYQLLISGIIMQKSRLFHHFVLKSCNVIGKRTFWPNMTEKQNYCKITDLLLLPLVKKMKEK